MLINTENLLEIKKNMPQNNFVDIQFDFKANVKTENILVIFSTQRSGSTFLCDQIRLNNFCLPHEYFQPFHHLKILSDRWGCLKDSELNTSCFVEQLKKNRTYKNGWLGINLHGGHIETFKMMEKDFSDINFTYIHLVRKNEIAQAVSYYIASEGGQWNSHFKKKKDAVYSYQSILEKLLWIQEQNRMIKRYLSAKKYQKIIYEDLIQNPKEYISKITSIPLNDIVNQTTQLKKQANKINDNFILQFRSDYKKNYIKNTVKKFLL